MCDWFNVIPAISLPGDLAGVIGASDAAGGTISQLS